MEQGSDVTPYSKYGEWECGEWHPYEDMEGY